MSRTWILIADASEATIFEVKDRLAQEWNEVEHVDNPRGRLKPTELNTDSPGSAHHFAGDARRSGMEPPTDAQDIERRRFARELADKLAHSAACNEFDNLVLVAPPTFLGMLRECIHNTTAESHVIGSINKDYTKLAKREMREVVGPNLPMWR